MLNRFRQLDILLFKVDDAIVIEKMALSPGWNQLIRIENTYYFKKIEDNHFYTKIATDKGHLFIAKILNYDDFYSDLN